jgi:hypothetical protein
MNMEVGNALTDDVVHGDKRSLGIHGAFHDICEVPGAGEKRTDQIGWKIS